MDLVFATNNAHKIAEVKAMLSNKWKVKSLGEIDFFEDIPETGNTLEENAFQKAGLVHRKLAVDCFADDTGLEVEALNGAPGVFSARFAGPENNSHANMQKLLRLMEGNPNRKARFRTVILLILGGESYYFEGVIEGTILTQPEGVGGFGYDPIFQPLGADISFGCMSASEKNIMSHRARAVQKLVDFLEKVEDV